MSSHFFDCSILVYKGGDNKMNSVIDKVKLFSSEKHKDQKRKFTGDPYFIHPERVAEYVRNAGGTEDQICAAYLHDTIEDCGITEIDLQELAGKNVAKLVVELTNDRAEEKKLGKSEYLLNKLSAISEEAFLVKLFDILDNAEEALRVGDDKFRKSFRDKYRFVFDRLKRDLNIDQIMIIKNILNIFDEL